jgi:ABC-type branched-subunit amino acid transport system substrate-binding protein
LFLTPDVAAQIYQKMRSLGLNIPVYTNEQLHGHKDFAAQAGAIADPTLYFIVDFDENSPAVRAFLASLPQSPTLPLYSVVAYDTMQWLAALVAENGTDNRKVKDALYKMKYKGLFTTYVFDDRGDLRESHWVPWKVTAEGYVRLRED